MCVCVCAYVCENMALSSHDPIHRPFCGLGVVKTRLLPNHLSSRRRPKIQSQDSRGRSQPGLPRRARPSRQQSQRPAWRLHHG
ncbi:hypothetical protein AALO_G00237540 [Alosa alosa]|uniref:Uncharacterized protein n=1 Tax=Alosa alosa TaxID=278164 RepID=A0AAV6FVN6_9TELE|nr:hypothetical protein AALO_G00237540 [Alosa alosa]